ncbi:MAG: hypothetical protein ACD_44C00156G0002 [uncultured bacterium]|nr:MAG: hypothetical protein ACD_44C00156G0002 [uncultured bacterium]OGT67661.1 MAG: transcription elongation factor GreAB [Gammaproteobacteria bacterium RIFCSPLOWO2_02_FULL_38_11]OGT76505.1 MAG: transcription elongation factor GreAB [Gammaproteobacteria bacterium RIFCSPLOWO2_12_FULL_38_14]
MTHNFKQGGIWTANLDPRFGTEPGKTRPVLIIQNQILLDAKHPSTLIIPLTTKLVEDAAPLRLRIKAKNKLFKDSDLLIDQLCALDNSRLQTGPLLICDENFMQQVYQAVLEVLGVIL